jgi:spore protease
MFRRNLKDKRHYRTDIASEAAELLRGERKVGRAAGVISTRTEKGGFTIDTVRIINAKGARTLGKPMGRYVTIGLDLLVKRREHGAFNGAARVIAAELRLMMADQGIENEPVLAVGLGNEAVTSDSIGPTAVRKILATRKIAEDSGLREVSCLSAGVLGSTGIEAAEILRGVIKETSPGAVIIADALAASDSERLCGSVQISNGGIVPGSGVGNARAALNKAVLGIPVIAIGVPTITDIGNGLVVTPRAIDAYSMELGYLLAYSVNLALQGTLSEEEVRELMRQENN